MSELRKLLAKTKRQKYLAMIALAVHTLKPMILLYPDHPPGRVCGDGVPQCGHAHHDPGQAAEQQTSGVQQGFGARVTAALVLRGTLRQSAHTVHSGKQARQSAYPVHSGNTGPSVGLPSTQWQSRYVRRLIQCTAANRPQSSITEHFTNHGRSDDLCFRAR